MADLKIPGMMEKAGLVRHAILRPADMPNLVTGLASALLSAEALPELTAIQYDLDSLSQLLTAAPEQAILPIRQGLARAAETAQLLNNAQARLLLVVDQMEELFTLGHLNQGDREHFVKVLQVLAQSGLVWVIATLRSDFFDRLVTLPDLMAMSHGEGRYLLAAPSATAIGQIIRQPAREAGLRFEQAPQTGVTLDEVLLETAAKNLAALPLLEFTLEQLWQNQAQQGLLTYAAYYGLGGIEGAISQKAEQLIKTFGADVATVLTKVLRRLVTVELDTGEIAARWVAKETFPPGTRERDLVEKMLSEDARLLVAEGDEHSVQIRVTHEALLTHWQRAQQQIEKDRIDLQIRGRLEQAARRWQQAEIKARPSLLLPSGVPLQEGQGLLQRWLGELDAGLVDYVQASVKAQRRRKQKLAWTGLGIALLLPFGVGAWFAVRVFLGVLQVESDLQSVAIPPGCFIMGSPITEADRQEDENQHEVCVSGFALGKFEVTQGQWQKVMLANPSSVSTGIGENYPVNMVNWDEVNRFITAINLWGKHHYRLPTEAEWEYAARGRTVTSIRYWGDSEKQACQYANVTDAQFKALGGKAIGLWFACDDGYPFSTAPVGTYQPNSYGLYDMLGNVWEWTCSAYTTNYDGSEKVCNNNAIISRRVYRGGSWDSAPANVRSATRYGSGPSYLDHSLGFRLAQDR